MIYIVIACHFRSRDELCGTTLTRLETVYCVAEKNEDRIIVTGDVPYVPDGPTLGKLMQKWLLKRRVPESAVSILLGGVGTFSEARIACEYLRNEKEVTIISSSWYFLQGKPIWRRLARENNIKVSFISVPNTGGWRTVLTYMIIGAVVHIAFFVGLGLERVLEKFLTASQTKRRKGFTFDGCK